MEALLAQEFFSLVDHLERGRIYSTPIRNTGGEASHGWFIPDGHSQHMCDCTYLMLAHTRLFQRTAYTKFTGCPLAWSKVTIIIFIHAISNITYIMLSGDWL